MNQDEELNAIGIVSVIVSMVSFFVCWWLSAIAIVIGIIAIVLRKHEYVTPTLGISLGIISLFLTIMKVVIK